MNRVAILFAFVLLAVTFLVAVKVQLTVREPYMDEIFHVDQISQFCDGNFTYWNPKISTPPGLYLFTLPFVYGSRLFTNLVPMACSLPSLRFYNLAWLLLLFALCYQSRAQLYIERRKILPALEAMSCSLMPMLYFSSFLYYTDLLSTITVLAMYIQNRRGCLLRSILLSIASVLMRQTNIIWVAFCVGLTFIDNLQLEFEVLSKKDENFQSDHDCQTLPGLARSCATLWRQFKLSQLITFLTRPVLSISGYLLIFIVFLIFILVNRGLAFGDHSAHQPVPHVPQILYCMTMLAGLSHIHFLNLKTIGDFCRFLRRNLAGCCCLLVTCLVSVHFFTYEHAYLLADNRHFTFYLWRKIYKRHFTIPYLMALVYIPSIWCVAHGLRKKSQIWRLGYAVCVALVVVPNKLLEFRYFITPYLLWRLNFSPALVTHKTVAMEIVLFAVVNMITLYLFIFHPFEWSHEPGIQRFMW